MEERSSESIIPSTPSRADQSAFSDEPARTSSPPSSPPCFPWELQHESQNKPDNPAPSSINAFSVLGKRKTLGDISSNTRPAKKAALTTAKKSDAPLQQMQLSLGQRVQSKCGECGMEYVASSPEDRTLHAKFHKQMMEGYDVGRVFIRDTPKEKLFRISEKDNNWVVAIDCMDSAPRKKHGQAVLEIVQRELGAVPIPSDSIWRRHGAADTPPVYTNAVPSGYPNKYRAYMYICGTKCVGFLLAKSIEEAHPIMKKPAAATAALGSVGPSNSRASALSALSARQQAETEALKQPIEPSTRTVASVLGISRIWVQKDYRNQNIATDLLDRAVERHNMLVDDNYDDICLGRELEGKATGVVKSFEMYFEEWKLAHEWVPRIEVDRKHLLVAFSQPTQAGAALARSWFKRLYGWCVYTD